MKIASIGHRLRLVVGAKPTPTIAPAVDATPVAPGHEFVAYSEDCLLVGQVRLSAARLTDLLNEHDEVELVDVQVVALDGSRAHEVTTAVVPREELLLVHATGPRGDRARRLHTRQHPVAMQLGPYHVRGYLHSQPGADAIGSFRRRTPMVPLTDAWVEYEQAGVRQRRGVATLLVNRSQVEWIAEVVDDEVEMPDIPLTADKGVMVKDFTGQLFGG